MQVDPAKIMTTTADAVGCLMGDIGMSSISGSFKIGRFSLDAVNACELESDRKVSFNTIA